MNHPRTNRHAANHIIDQTLHRLGSAQPQSGMNDRILRHLRQLEAQPAPHAIFRTDAAAWPRLAFASLAGCALCAAVVVGSVQHSHTVAAQNHSVTPILQPHNGVATASSTHISAHPAIAPKDGGRSNHHTGKGRATVKPGTHVHGGDGISIPPHNP